MIIKLSDYILEQSISDSEVNDIMLEQAIAEVEVTSAICESYMKQMILEADDETVDDQQSSSGQATGFIEKVKRFFISIGNWFRRMWIKFTGWLSERKLARIIRKLEAMSPEEQKNFTGTVPFATPEDAEAAINWFNDKTVEFNQRIDKIAGGEEYNVRDLQADLSTIKGTEHSEYKPTETPVKMNYKSYLDVMKRLFNEYSKNKVSIKNTTASMKQDKFKNLAAKMNGKDPKEVKIAYSYIKKVYQKYSAESSKFINMLMKYLGEAEKIHKNNPDAVAPIKLNFSTMVQESVDTLDNEYLSKFVIEHKKNMSPNTVCVVFNASNTDAMSKYKIEVEHPFKPEETSQKYLIAIIDNNSRQLIAARLVNVRSIMDNIKESVDKNGVSTFNASDEKVPDNDKNVEGAKFNEGFTQKDLDFLELMHLLATASGKST